MSEAGARSWVVPIVEDALRLPDASLVIYRLRTLVEFKTDLLGTGLSRFEEHGHVSWQIGAFESHHCHLDIDAVTRVAFGAEPVGCQGGRLNYTVWFETAEDAGNPYRPNGYFSVTLNRPYELDGSPRHDIFGAMFDLYAKWRHQDGVDADAAFVRQWRSFIR